MSLPSFNLPVLRSPEAIALEELRQVNEYLEILIEMFARAFPNAAPDNLKEKMQEARESRRQIGFQTDK
jgi:hypothetical protein